MPPVHKSFLISTLPNLSAPSKEMTLREPLRCPPFLFVFHATQRTAKYLKPSERCAKLSSSFPTADSRRTPVHTWPTMKVIRSGIISRDPPTRNTSYPSLKASNFPPFPPSRPECQRSRSPRFAFRLADCPALEVLVERERPSLDVFLYEI